MSKLKKKVKEYGQYCPVAKSLDVVGDRWTLLIVRDLMRGKQRFKDLQDSLSGIAPNLLSDRLKKLEEAGLVVRTFFKQLPPKVEYTLTDQGKALEAVLASLARFGMANLMQPPEETEVVDPEFIFQAMPQVFLPERVPAGTNLLYRIDLEGEGGGTWFLNITKQRCRVLREAPSKPKVTISTDVETWAEIATGLLDPKEAEKLGSLKIKGDRTAASQLASFFLRPGDRIPA